jgi:hypothetical protein
VAGVSRILCFAALIGAAGALAAAALAAPGDPKLALKPADVTYARTIILKPADIKKNTGWAAAATDFGRVNPVCIVKHYSLSKLTATAQVGRTFSRNVGTGTFLVESDVHVFKTPAQAAAATKITSSTGYAHCLGSVLAGEVPAGSFGTFKTKQASLSGLKATATGFEIDVKVVSQQGTTKLTAWVINLRKGRAVGTLSVLTVGKGWTQDDVRAAAATMAARMR